MLRLYRFSTVRSTVPSELRPQRELEVALAAFGKDFSEGRSASRIQSDIGGATATATTAPIRMVPDVECFGAELEAKPFIHGNSLEQAHVPVLESGLVDHVANALGVEGSRRGFCKYRRAIGIGCGEPLAGWAEGTDDLGIAVHDPVLAVHAASKVGVETHAGVISRPGNAARQPSLELGDTADLPSAERFADEADCCERRAADRDS